MRLWITTLSFGLLACLLGIHLFLTDSKRPIERHLAQSESSLTCIELLDQLYFQSTRATQSEFETILKIADDPQALTALEESKVQFALQRLSSSLKVYSNAIEGTLKDHANKEQLKKFIDEKMQGLKSLKENLNDPEVLKLKAQEFKHSLAFLFPEHWLHQQVSRGPYGFYDFDISKYRWPKVMNPEEVEQFLPIIGRGKKFMANIRHQNGYYLSELPTSEHIEKVSYRWIRLVKGLPIYHAEILVKFKQPIEFISQSDPLQIEFLDHMILSTYAARAPGESYNPLIGLISKRYTRVDAIETLATHQAYHDAKKSEIHHLELNLSKEEMDQLFPVYLERAGLHKGDTPYNTLLCSCITASFDFLDLIRKPKVYFPKLPFFFEFQLRIRELLKNIRQLFE